MQQAIVWAYYTCGNILLEMRCNFFQWIDGPDMYDRVFIKQKYMFNYTKRPKTFERWKPYVLDPIEKAPEEPRKAGWCWTPEQETEYDRAERTADKEKAPASETGCCPRASRRPGELHIEESISQNMVDFETGRLHGQCLETRGRGRWAARTNRLRFNKPFFLIPKSCKHLNLLDFLKLE